MSMNDCLINADDRIGDIVLKYPALSRIFEEEHIDYCCGGKKSIGSVCEQKGISLQHLLEKLNDNRFLQLNETDVSQMGIDEIVDHIECTHHKYLHLELSRLEKLLAKISVVHGEKDNNLCELNDVFLKFSSELSSHMMKEEQILFPMIREMVLGNKDADAHCGSIVNPLRQMEKEHEEAGSQLAKMRYLAHDYVVPEWACNTYRVAINALEALEKDMYRHVHKENNVLFPRILEFKNQNN